MKGYLLLDSYGGRTRTEVRIVGVLRSSYRIKALKKTKLAGRDRWLNAGDATLVPRHAVELTP